MKRKITAVILTVVLLFSFISADFATLTTADPMIGNHLPVVYIENDGSINPPITAINRVGDVYTFAGNIVNYVIWVHRGNIVIDGLGYGMQTKYPSQGLWGDDNAITISSVSNVTVKNVKIEGFSKGIIISDSSHNNIIGNNISDCRSDPISLDSCSYCNIAKNILTNNSGLLFLSRCENNSITDNNIAKNSEGIFLSFSANNKIVGNNITLNTVGVHLSGVLANYFYFNNFVNNTSQVYIRDTAKELPNVWDNGEVGNFWSNYDGTDANGDGIGESPFIVETAEPVNITFWNSITVGVNQQDSFPLMELYVGQKLPLPTDAPLPTNALYSIEVYVIAFAVSSIIVGMALLVYFKKHGRGHNK